MDNEYLRGVVQRRDLESLENYYIETHSSPLDSVLQQIERQTHTSVLGADMLAGQIQGRLLEMLSRMITPSLVLEVGTFTGFSTVCLTRGLSEDGRLITLEKNDELKEVILRNLAAAGVADKVDLRIGDALDLLRIMSEKNFDLIYLDADKERYIDYYPLLLPLLRKGGWLIADNTLWSGKVADSTATDKVTEFMRKFNDMLIADKQIECVMLPVRDGLTIVRKK